ncbi:MAG TPA: ABC transporter permease, partial [Gemmatimonadales bacterium]|nr:ABC transporter permease [Gemmatimonadales bacterium]
QDLRYTFRGLKNRPLFAGAVVLTLALGIGANASMFSIVDRLLFRPPPMLHDASHVHRIYSAHTYRGKEYTNGGMPYARYVDLTRDTRSFGRTAEFTTRKMAIGVGESAHEMTVGIVSASFFRFFDAPPAAGRYFTPAEDRPPSGTPVAVLSYGLWETRYGEQPGVVGQTLQIGPETYTIIGIAPKGFVGLWPETPPAAYIPITSYGGALGKLFGFGTRDWWTTYGLTFASMLAERKPGVSLTAANADLTQAYRRSYQAAVTAGQTSTPITLAKPHAIAGSVLSDRGPNASSVSKVALWIGGVAIIVWLIACANVANLLLARALQRRREIAVRLALGVSRLRLAGQLLTESLVLGVLGGAVGLVVAQWGGAILRGAFLSDTAHATVITDPRSLLYAGAAAVVAGLLTGFAPLFQTRHTDLTRDLREGVREGTYQHSRLRAALLVMQAALCVVLLVGAGLFVRSLRHVRAVPLGFDASHVAEVDLNMRGVHLDSARTVTLLDQLRTTAAALPGVSHVSRQLTTPFWSEWNLDLHVAGIDSVSRLGSFALNAVSPDYFATMGTRLLEGRGIGPQDVAGAPRAMVVSQAMAKKLWPEKDALGQCVRVSADTAPCTYVVGVAENIKTDNLSEDPGLFYYLSSAQFHPNQGGLFLRVRGDAATEKETVRKALQPLMPGAAYVTVTPLADIIGKRTQSWELGALMFVVFGLLALVLAAIGLYSVIAFNVSQRLHELGVRIALGATMRDVVGHVVSGGIKLAAAGIVVGAGIALGVSHWVEPLLFQESSRDPTVFVLVSGVLFAVAALASFIPARRAARVDPMRALRTE